MNKKKAQLGMNPSTASGRLLKDILFELVGKTGQKDCHRCGEELTRETFSIEHIVPWLDSEDPVGLYFDLDNISFSHQACNHAARRVPNKKYHTAEERQKARNEIERKRWAALSTVEPKLGKVAEWQCTCFENRG